MFEDGHWDFCYQINSMETKTQVFINNNNNNVLCHLTQLPWGIWFWKVSSFMENWTHGIRAITTEKQSRAHTASQKLFPNWQKTTRGRRRDYLRPSHASGLDQWRSSAGTPNFVSPGTWTVWRSDGLPCFPSLPALQILLNDSHVLLALCGCELGSVSSQSPFVCKWVTCPSYKFILCKKSSKSGPFRTGVI